MTEAIEPLIDPQYLRAKALHLFPYKKEGKANPNSQQQDIINQVLDISSPGGLIVNASTGSGKTAASLTALLTRVDFTKQKILVFVRTISQMDPIIREWSRIIGGVEGLKTKGTPLILPIKGKDRLCRIKSSVQQFSQLKTESVGAFCRIKPCVMWPGHSKYQSNLKTHKMATLEALNRSLAIAVERTHSSPVNELDDFYKRIKGCGYYNQMEMLLYARIVVATYAYMGDIQFNNLCRLSGIEIEDSLVLVDEAHNLANKQETELSLDQIDTVAGLIGETDLIRAMKKAVLIEKQFNHPDELAPSYAWEHTMRLLTRPTDDDMFRLNMNKWDLLLPEVVSFTSFVNSRTHGVIKGGDDQLRIIEATPTRKLSKFADSSLIIFQSGTIEPLEDYKAIFGMHHLATLATEPKIKDNKFKCYLQARGLTSKRIRRGEKLFGNMAATIIELTALSPRHTLVICPGYSFLQNLESQLKRIYPDTHIITERRDSTMEELTRGIKYSDVRKLILGVSGGKISEGVEVVREGYSLLSLVIMAGMAFQPPSKDHFLLRSERLKATKDTLSAQKFQQTIPVLQMIEQSFGRAVRAEHDRGALVILDHRAGYYQKDLELKHYTSVPRLKNRLNSFFDGYPDLEKIL